MNTHDDISFSVAKFVGTLIVALVAMRLESVPTGTVGVRSTFGATAADFLPPGGPYVVVPGVHALAKINIKPQVDQVASIECSTKEGVAIVFPVIQVYNQLPAARVVSVINEYGVDYDRLLVRAQVVQRVLERCNDMTLEEIRTSFSDMNDAIKTGLVEHQTARKTGLVVTDVIVHKPIFPSAIQDNYDRKAEERTALQAQVDTQARRLKEAETSRLMLQAKHAEELLAAEHASAVQLTEASANAKRRGIASGAHALELKELAAANVLLHTDAYMRVHYQENVLAKATAYWGNKLPAYVGSLLANATQFL